MQKKRTTAKALAHCILILSVGYFWIYALLHREDVIFLICSGVLALQIYCAYKDLFGGDDGQNSGPGSFNIPAHQT